MKSNTRLIAVLTALVLVSIGMVAAEPNPIRDELASIIGDIREKSGKSMTTAEELAPELKRFDDLIAAHAGEKSEDLASALYSQARLYLSVVKDPEKARAIAERLKTEFSQTPSGRQADSLLKSIQQAPPPPSGIEADLAAIKSKVDIKIRAGKTEEADFAPELALYDALYDKHKSEKTDVVGSILGIKASFYLQVLKLPEKAKATLARLKADFPAGSVTASNAERMLSSVDKQAESAKIQAALVVGAMFPDFQARDTAGQPVSLARFKGKVTLIDFWAMWCGPCMEELPNVVKTYQKYHAGGFEIMGVSLDRDGDGDALEKFRKDKNMPWPQYFDGQFWQTKLAVQYGINSIPATYLLDGDGKIIARDLRGEALDAAVAKALGK